MNKLQIAEIKKHAQMESIKLANENMWVWCLIKNGTSLAKITASTAVAKHYIQVENYSLYGLYLNGLDFDADERVEIAKREFARF